MENTIDYSSLAKQALAEGKYEECVEFLQQGTVSKQLPCMVWLAQCLGEGCFVKKDKKEAVSLLKEAAEALNPRAMAYLAQKLKEGRGCEKNEQQAKEWAEKAKSTGEAFSVGFVMYHRLCSLTSNERVFDLFVVAAEENEDYRAMGFCGRCLFRGPC